jgi:hypothetical protein
VIALPVDILLKAVKTYLIICAPLLFGAVQETATDPEDATYVIVAASTVAGMPFGTPATAVEAVPSPIDATARSLTLYVVPFVNEEIVKGEVVPAGNETQAVPLSIEYL